MADELNTTSLETAASPEDVKVTKPDVKPAEADKKPEGDYQPGQLNNVQFWENEAREARKEANKQRQKAIELDRRLKADEQKRLEEQGNWQKLYEQTKADLVARESELESGSVYKTAFERALQKRIAQVPEVNRALIPTDYEPIKLSDWLDANWERLGARKFPNLDAGAGGAGGNNVAKTPTPEAFELARKLKIDPQKLVK